MRLSGRNDAQVGIRVAGVVVVHVQTSRVEVADVDEVAVGRAPSYSFPSVHRRFTRCISSEFYIEACFIRATPLEKSK